MEKGFFHPELGYWQVVGAANEDLLFNLPEGAFEVPLKPNSNSEFKGGIWVNVPPKEPTLEEQKKLRQFAYVEEADPLFFKVQRGEATLEEWQEKIAEIKVRYPYPAE